MSKIIVSILILTLASSCLTQADMEDFDTYPDVSVGIFNALDLAEGFFEGFGLYSNIPGEEECLSADPQIGKNIEDVLNKLKGIKLTTNFKNLAKEIFAKLEDTAQRLQRQSGDCGQWGIKVAQVNIGLVKWMSKSGYINNLGKHAISNLKGIKSRLEKIFSAIRNQKIRDAGFSLGDTLKFVLFWDFRQGVSDDGDDDIETNTETELVHLTTRDVDAGALAEGFLSGWGFYDSIAHDQSCISGDPQITQDFVDIVNLVQGINWYTNFGDLTKKVWQKVNDVAVRISSLGQKCLDWGQEIIRVNSLLKDHTSKSGYLLNVAKHSYSNYYTIYTKLRAARSALSANNSYDAGFAFGDAVKFVFFWDFKLPEQAKPSGNYKNFFELEDDE